MPSAETTLTRALAERAGEWVLPHWLEAQSDPANPSYVPAPAEGPVSNLCHTERVPIGTLGSARVATVDPRGLVTPWPGGWSVDWWVGADDRWHVPSREVAVRQALVGDAPVVETSMRVPGGDVVERAWVFHDVEAGEVLALEIENTSRVPVAIALAVRPYGPDGASRVGSVSIDGTEVRVDGGLAMWLPKPPSRSAASTWHDGDVATAVLTGGAPEDSRAHATCTDGLAQAAMVFPVAHSTSLQVLVPLSPAPADRPRRAPSAVPPADAVSRGWSTHSGRGLRVVLPDARLHGAFAAARAQVLLAAAGRDLSSGDVRETAGIVRALDRCGLHVEADAIVATAPEGQGRGGRLGGDDHSGERTGAVLHAAGSHWAVGRDAGLVDALAGLLAAGAHHRPGRLRGRRGSAVPGVEEAAWRFRGALDVQAALAGVGQSEAADAIGDRLADLGAPVDGSAATDMLHGTVADMVERLDLVVPLEIVTARSAVVDELLDRIRTDAVHRGAVLRRRGLAGLSPERTARLGQAEVRRGEPSALDRLGWLVDTVERTHAPPQVVHPRTGGGGPGAGWSPGAAAALVELVADLLAHVAAPRARAAAGSGAPSGATELVLCAVLPEEWLGAGVEVHGLATSVGTISYAVRWHGERPALLWELVAHAGVGEVRITAPGLDPSWSSTEPRGDALLSVPPTAPPSTAEGTVEEPTVPDEGGSFA